LERLLPADPLAPAAERTLRLIELLLSRPEGWTPQELLVQLDLSRSSLFVLLRTLKTLGYVEQAGIRGRYVPGPRLQAWRAPQSPSAQELLTAFYQEVETAQSSVLSTETLALVLPAGGRGARSQEEGFIIVAQVEGSQQVRSAFITGQRVVSLPAAQVLDPSPSPTVIETGFALHASPETIDLALPICRDGRTPEAALLFSAPAFRWTPDGLLAACLEDLRQMAAHLSYRLGAPLYAPYRPQAREEIQATAALTAEEIGAFLRGPWAASLACIRPDGRPHVIPVWQEWDGQAFYVIAWQGSQWADYLRANPNVSLTVDEPWAPLRRIAVQGCAAAYEASQAEIERLVHRMTRRYLGQPLAPGLPQQVQCAFRIQPDSLRGWRGLPVENRAAKVAVK
jgi:DNA-binding IclR family transcriptional regulator